MDVTPARFAAGARRLSSGTQSGPAPALPCPRPLTLLLPPAPPQAARVLFGSAAKPAEDQHGHVLGLVACGLAAAASLAFALEECARRHMLHNFTGACWPGSGCSPAASGRAGAGGCLPNIHPHNDQSSTKQGMLPPSRPPLPQPTH